jgi:hypothetical protein
VPFSLVVAFSARAKTGGSAVVATVIVERDARSTMFFIVPGAGDGNASEQVEIFFEPASAHGLLCYITGVNIPSFATNTQ